MSDFSKHQEGKGSLARSRLAWVEGVVTFNLKRAERLRQSILRKGFSGRF
jgi:hypothetical protein